MELCTSSESAPYAAGSWGWRQKKNVLGLREEMREDAQKGGVLWFTEKQTQLNSFYNDTEENWTGKQENWDRKPEERGKKYVVVFLIG